MPETWLDSQSRAIDYHPGGYGRGGDYIYYDPWRRYKIDETSGLARERATRVISDDLECGRVHLEEELERAVRDDSG